MARVGILGGTFNPPHLGHLAVARHAREQLGLDRVLLMPVHTPPHKPGGADPGPIHRLAMCRLLCEGQEGVQACALEVQRGGPSYTVDTLKTLQHSHPEAQLTFIVGADTARTLPSWREPQAVLGLAGLAVAARAGTEREKVLEALSLASPEGASVLFLAMPTVDISSSDVRARVARGEPVEALVGDRVARYVAEHGLYARDGRDA